MQCFFPFYGVLGSPKEDIHVITFVSPLNVLDIVAFSINLQTKCVFLVMFRPPPLPPLYAFVYISVTPPPPLDAYVINGRPPTENKLSKDEQPLNSQCSKLRFHIVQTQRAWVAKIVHSAICPCVLPYIKVSIF